MESWQIVLGVIGAIVAIFGLSFTVFWSIIKNVETRLSDKLDTFTDTINNCQGARTVKIKEYDDKFSSLFSSMAKRPTFVSCEETYVRKREHDLEFGILKDKLDAIQYDFKELKKVLERE